MMEKFLNVLNDIKKENPIANYVSCKEINGILYLSGQLPKDILKNNDKIICGKVGDNLTIDEAKYAAKLCAMQLIIVLKHFIGGDIKKKIKECLQLNVFVNSKDDFTLHHLVANDASDFLCHFFGKDIGSHTRVSVGVSSLPLGAVVEISGIFSIND